ncbi:MAG: MarR family winged helix-turn-helix transcriptional regulator [Hyphomonadaceae bacterium]
MSDREEGGYVLSRSPCHLLHRAQQFAADRFGAADITLRQFAVLAAVSNRSGQTQTDLVNATGIDRSTLADMILRMEERGLLARGRSAEDGRAKSVTLTASGRSAFASAAPRVRSADEAILSALPKNKRTPFLETLQRLAVAADETPEEPIPPQKQARARKAGGRARKAAPRTGASGRKPARKAPARSRARR